jgi:hypothetical protein
MLKTKYSNLPINKDKKLKCEASPVTGRRGP